jgi:hypothetical protein
MEELPGYAKVPWTVGGRYCLEVDAVVLRSGEREIVATIFSARRGGDRARTRRDTLIQRGASSGPAFALPGKGTLEMNSLCVGFAVDGRGHFL